MAKDDSKKDAKDNSLYRKSIRGILSGEQVLSNLLFDRIFPTPGRSVLTDTKNQLKNQIMRGRFRLVHEYNAASKCFIPLWKVWIDHGRKDSDSDSFLRSAVLSPWVKVSDIRIDAGIHFERSDMDTAQTALQSEVASHLFKVANEIQEDLERGNLFKSRYQPLICGFDATVDFSDSTKVGAAFLSKFPTIDRVLEMVKKIRIDLLPLFDYTCSSTDSPPDRLDYLCYTNLYGHSIPYQTYDAAGGVLVSQRDCTSQYARDNPYADKPHQSRPPATGEIPHLRNCQFLQTAELIDDSARFHYQPLWQGKSGDYLYSTWNHPAVDLDPVSLIPLYYQPQVTWFATPYISLHGSKWVARTGSLVSYSDNAGNTAHMFVLNTVARLSATLASEVYHKARKGKDATTEAMDTFSASEATFLKKRDQKTMYKGNEIPSLPPVLTGMLAGIVLPSDFVKGLTIKANPADSNAPELDDHELRDLVSEWVEAKKLETDFELVTLISTAQVEKHFRSFVPTGGVFADAVVLTSFGVAQKRETFRKDCTRVLRLNDHPFELNSEFLLNKVIDVLVKNGFPMPTTGTIDDHFKEFVHHIRPTTTGVMSPAVVNAGSLKLLRSFMPPGTKNVLNTFESNFDTEFNLFPFEKDTIDKSFGTFEPSFHSDLTLGINGVNHASAKPLVFADHLASFYRAAPSDSGSKTSLHGTPGPSGLAAAAQTQIAAASAWTDARFGVIDPRLGYAPIPPASFYQTDSKPITGFEVPKFTDDASVETRYTMMLKAIDKQIVPNLRKNAPPKKGKTEELAYETSQVSVNWKLLISTKVWKSDMKSDKKKQLFKNSNWIWYGFHQWFVDSVTKGSYTNNHNTSSAQTAMKEYLSRDLQFLLLCFYYNFADWLTSNDECKSFTALIKSDWRTQFPFSILSPEKTGLFYPNIFSLKFRKAVALKMKVKLPDSLPDTQIENTFESLGKDISELSTEGAGLRDDVEGEEEEQAAEGKHDSESEEEEDDEDRSSDQQSADDDTPISSKAAKRLQAGVTKLIEELETMSNELKEHKKELKDQNKRLRQVETSVKEFETPGKKSKSQEKEEKQQIEALINGILTKKKVITVDDFSKMDDGMKRLEKLIIVNDTSCANLLSEISGIKATQRKTSDSVSKHAAKLDKMDVDLLQELVSNEKKRKLEEPKKSDESQSKKSKKTSDQPLPLTPLNTGTAQPTPSTQTAAPTQSASPAAQSLGLGGTAPDSSMQAWLQQMLTNQTAQIQSLIAHSQPHQPATPHFVQPLQSQYPSGPQQSAYVPNVPQYPSGPQSAPHNPTQFSYPPQQASQSSQLYGTGPPATTQFLAQQGQLQQPFYQGKQF